MEWIKKHKFYLLIAGITSLTTTILLFNTDTPTAQENKRGEIQGFNTSETKNATISGIVTLSGVIPENAEISIKTRKIGEENYQQVVSGINASSEMNWTWDGAEDGEPYEIKAVMDTNGSQVESQAKTIVAPAINETLKIISTEDTQKKESAGIKGTIDINGHIPPQSTVTLVQRTRGDQNFSTIGGNIQARDGVDWQWVGTAGTSYEIQAHLISNGATIGTSNTVTTTAPAQNETLVINSQATPQTTEETNIQGTINLNGRIKNGSTITVRQKVSGQKSFTEVAQITAKDETNWSWEDAQTGITYDVQAYIKDADNVPYAQSEIVTVTAPSSENTLTVNVAYQPIPPGNDSITSACIEKNTKGKWQVEISMNDEESIQNVNKLWLKLGSIHNEGEFIDAQIVPQDPNKAESLITDFILTENTTYYARYAYENCDCGTFSPFSQPIKVNCSD